MHFWCTFGILLVPLVYVWCTLVHVLVHFWCQWYTFGSVLAVALAPYVHDRCSRSAYSEELGAWSLPRTARLAWRFVQQLHGRTVNALRAAAHLQETPWILREEWLATGVVRTVISSMLLPLVWRQCERSPPHGAWGWKDMYILEGESTTILTATLRGFLAASPDDILRVARDASQLRPGQLLE